MSSKGSSSANIEFNSKLRSVLFLSLSEPNVSGILNINELYETLSKRKRTKYLFVFIIHG